MAGVLEKGGGAGVPTPLLKHIPSDLTSSHQALSFNTPSPSGLTRLGPSASYVSLCWMYRPRLQQAHLTLPPQHVLLPISLCSLLLRTQVLLRGFLPFSLHSISIL